MATRYFKRNNGREVCSMSSGNRSSSQPGEPGYPHDWAEIDRKEFVRLRRKLERGPAGLVSSSKYREGDNIISI